jgi:hypothetical protein
VLIDDQPSDLVDFIGDERLGQKRRQRNVSKRQLGGHSLAIVFCGHAGQRVAASLGRRLRKQRL